MTDKKNLCIGILGGDRRMTLLAEILKSHDYQVKLLYAYDSNNCEKNDVCHNIDELFSLCNIIALPIPISRDGVNILVQSTDVVLSIEDVIFASRKYGKKTFFGGQLSTDLKAKLNALGHTAIDLLDDSDLVCKNALATAEGALSIAMERLETTVDSSNFAVIGYGRIGSYLGKILTALGGRVTVFARRDEVLLEAKRQGMSGVKLDGDSQNIASALDKAQVIFNTVPIQILNEEIVVKMLSRPLYIELASKPYGIDPEVARRLNFNTLYAPSLPGRYSPVSAAEYIFSAIDKHIKK